MKHFFVETIYRADNQMLQVYLDHMVDEGFELVNLTPFNRPVNEQVSDYHFIWKISKNYKPKPAHDTPAMKGKKPLRDSVK